MPPPVTTDMPPVALLRRSVFAPHQGEDFAVLRGDKWVSLRLDSVTTLGGHKDEDREKFSLLFTAGTELPLQQGMHDFEHPALGCFNLFFTPVISRDPAVRCYEAVINREV